MQICRGWQQKGECKFGNSCKFSHDAETGVTSTLPIPPTLQSRIRATAAIPATATSKEVCRKFLVGTCSRGETCKYLHQTPSVSFVASARDESIISKELSSRLVDATAAAVEGERKQKSDRKRRKRNASSASLDSDNVQSTDLKVVSKATNKQEKDELKVASKQQKGESAVAVSLVAIKEESKPAVVAFQSGARFDSLVSVSVATRRAIAEVMKYEHMTPVQEMSIHTLLKGSDCLAKAKTGTGKTLAFLIPAIELLLRHPPVGGGTIPEIGVVILSPTRELAQQIATEATTLLTFHRDMRVVCVVGGTNVNVDKRQLMDKAVKRVDFLVATPGRLMDHLQNTPGFGARCGSTIKMLIMDEADQLLEMGFRPDIERILKFMPSQKNRQTLLFSATIPASVKDVAHLALRPDHAMIDTVGEESSEQTHLHVTQYLVVTDLPNEFNAVSSLIASHITSQSLLAGEKFKIIVFLTTARLASFYARVFQAKCGGDSSSANRVIEIHSRLSQSQRQKNSDRFRDEANVIMFSSDVSARGLDYPDVTYVIQVGLTEREQYIHRLGRTARAGKGGTGVLLVHDFEEASMRKSLKDMPLTAVALTDNRIYRQSLPSSVPRSPFSDLAIRLGALTTVADCSALLASDNELRKCAAQAYVAFLGFYNSNLRRVGWDKPQVVAVANEYSRIIGLHEVPGVEKKTIGKMGLKGVPGLRLL